MSITTAAWLIFGGVILSVISSFAILAGFISTFFLGRKQTLWPMLLGILGAFVGIAISTVMIYGGIIFGGLELIKNYI